MRDATPHAERAAILAWMTANNAGAAEASRKFGVPDNRIRQWLFVVRKGEPPTAPGTVPRVVAPERPNLTILPPAPEPKIALPPDIETLAQGVVKLALATMIRKLKDGDATVGDCAKVISAVTDRLDVFGGIAKTARDVSTPAAADLLDAAAVSRQFRERNRRQA